MKQLTTYRGPKNLERSHNSWTPSKQESKMVRRILVGLVILSFTIIAPLRAQEIVSKPESLKVYTDRQTISIEAREEIDYLELWDVSKSKRRMKFKPNKQSIKVNTQRLKKSDYQIVLFFGNDTKLIKFTI